MRYGVKVGQVQLQDDTMNYIRFGTGPKTLILIPGLGDGIAPVHGRTQAIAFAYGYRKFTKEYKVYLFSRKNHLGTGYSTRDMARDLGVAMEGLGITSADVMGVSQGGMIAQWLAIDHSHLVNRLVLTVTSARANDTLENTVKGWMDLAREGDYSGLMIDTYEKTYSEKYLKRYRPLYPILCKVGKPNSMDRFLVQAESCLSHNTYDQLGQITCPTYVIGGECDHVLEGYSSLEIARQIKGSKVYLYKELGHSTYEEAKDFQERVLKFFNL